MIKIYNIYNSLINETVHPMEVNTADKAIKSVLNGKRKIAFVTNLEQDDIDLFNSNENMESMRVKGNPNMAFIIYRNDVQGAKEDAIELRNIAHKYGGYLPITAGEDTYRIGILLGYPETEVKKFVKKNNKIN